MPIETSFEPLTFLRGPAWKNRLALAPMTNLQSLPDGRLGDDELTWLALRARGGFGLTMTCATQVHPGGQGFPGQLAASTDAHVEGLARLAREIRAAGSVSAVQLHHAGVRSPKDLVGTPVGPSEDAATGARALTSAEVEALREAFIAAAVRCQKAGFDGVEIHAAHGYLIAQFLSAESNRRVDHYGGTLVNRARFLQEIIGGVRAACGPEFQVGVRLSPERFGMRIGEVRDLVTEIIREADVDYVDLSLWDVKKTPEDPAYQERSLMGWFTDLPRHGVRLGVAGKILGAADVVAVLDAGCDFAMVGRGAILHHDFPERVRRDPSYVAPALPVSVEHLRREGLGESFINYMRTWKSFVAS